MKRRAQWVSSIAVLSALTLSACSGDDGEISGTGGVLAGTGGSTSGQTAQTGGQGGAVTAQGGTTASVVGTTSVGGSGTAVATGGTTGTDTLATGGVTATGGTTGSGTPATGGVTTTGGSTGSGTPATGGVTATGGTSATGGSSNTGGTSGSCDEAWSPPGTSEWSASYNGTTFDMATELAVVWDYMSQTYSPAPANFKNLAWDQIVANGGYLNYCIRFDQVANSETGNVLTATQRTQLQTLLETWINAWMETYMSGYDCWPYGHIDVNIVGYAVKSTSELENYTETTPVYTTTDSGGVPECDPRCGRYFLYNDVYSSYDSCPNGSANHYDMSLWLTAGMGWGGAGGDWGQRVDMDLVYDYPHIMVHEMGHSFGLPDFYNSGSSDFFVVETSDAATALGSESFVMQAGSAQEVTLFDGWMLRMQWNEYLKSRFGY